MIWVGDDRTLFAPVATTGTTLFGSDVGIKLESFGMFEDASPPFDKMLAMAGTLDEMRGTPGNKLLMMELLIGTAEATAEGITNGSIEASVGTAEAGRMLPPLGARTRLPLGMRLDGRGEASVIMTTAVAAFVKDDSTAEAAAC